MENERIMEDKEFKRWLETEIHSIYQGKKKVIPYKPALKASFVFAFSTISALRSYRKDYLLWRKIQ